MTPFWGRGSPHTSNKTVGLEQWRYQVEGMGRAGCTDRHTADVGRAGWVKKLDQDLQDTDQHAMTQKEGHSRQNDQAVKARPSLGEQLAYCLGGEAGRAVCTRRERISSQEEDVSQGGSPCSSGSYTPDS